MRGIFSKVLAASAVIVVGALTGCASGPTTRAVQDPQADFTAYKTFGFYDHSAGGRAGYSTILSQGLQQATRKHMERLGYVYTDYAPDLKVNFIVNVQNRRDVRSTGGPAYRLWRSGSFETIETREGLLAIDLVDRRQGALVWRGVAEGEIDDKATKDPMALIDGVVKEVFAKFPTATRT